MAMKAIHEQEVELYWQCCRQASRMLVTKIYHGVNDWYGVEEAISLALSIPFGQKPKVGSPFGQKPKVGSLCHTSEIAKKLEDALPRGFYVILLPDQRIFKIMPGCRKLEVSAINLLVEMQGHAWTETCVLVAFGMAGKFYATFLAAVWCPWWCTWSRVDPVDAHGVGLLSYYDKVGFELRPQNSDFKFVQQPRKV